MKIFRSRTLCLLAPAALLGLVPAAGARTAVGISVNLGGLAWSLVSGCHGTRVAVAAPAVVCAPRPVVFPPPPLFVHPPVVYAPPHRPVFVPHPPVVFVPPPVFVPAPSFLRPPRGADPHADYGQQYPHHCPQRAPAYRTPPPHHHRR
jgi:hypothetical protein